MKTNGSGCRKLLATIAAMYCDEVVKHFIEYEQFTKTITNMRNYVFLFVLLCSACAKFTDFEGEKTAITQLIDDETKFVAAADWPNWAKCSFFYFS